MKSKKLLLLVVSIAAVFASVTALPAAAQGDRSQLNGTYFFNGEQACLASSLGFNPNLTPVAGSVVSIQSASTQGTLQFNADGTGTANFKELLIVHPPASPLFAASTDASFSFTYTIGDDGALVLVSGLVNGRFTSGPLAGVTFTNNPPPMSGRIARDGTAIPLSTTDPAVETVALGSPLNTLLPRVCHRARTLIAIHVIPEN